jgi:serine/threonine protein phosphatase PrpC
MKYSSKSITNVGKVRSANEDNFGEAQTPNGHLFVVCDGMGGHVGGAEASRIAVNSMIEYFQKEVYDNVILAIDGALNFANEQIYASALSNPDLKGMGTTAVVLLIRNEECFIGHVGDSRIYLRSDGKLNRITKDHSFVQTLVDSGVIHDEDAENHPNKNQILQALGIAPSVKGTVCQSPILPKEGDMFLLCSDGLNGMVTDRDIENIMKVNNLMVASENLITAALNGGGLDNVTATLVLIEESAHMQSRFVHFNPKPKFNDMTSTQQFAGAVNNNRPKKNRLPFYIGGSVLFIGVCLAIWMLFFRNEVIEENSTKLLTQEDISSYVCKNLNDIKEDMKVGFSSGTITNKQCGDMTIFIVEDSVIVEIKKVKTNKPIVREEESPDKQQGIDAPKKVEDMTEREISALKVGTIVADQTGTFEKHGFKIVVENKKVKSIDKINSSSSNVSKIHTVKNGDNLNKIVDKYKENCPGLNIEKLIEHNKVSPRFKGDKAKLEQEKIDLGWKLEIPCD